METSTHANITMDNDTSQPPASAAEDRKDKGLLTTIQENNQ